TKTYRNGAQRVNAVDGVDVALRRGEVGVLVGRSGSGKSTLLMMLAGWQVPDAGEILFEGVAADPKALPWSVLGYVPQRCGLIPELSVRENLELPIRLGPRRIDAADRVEELLHGLGLAELANRLPAET